MAKIIGLGAWFPEQVRTNQDWSPELVQSFQDRLKRELLDIADHGVVSSIDQFSLDQLQQDNQDPFLGAVERRVMPAGMPAFQAEVLAARAALDQAGVDPYHLGAVLSYSFTEDRIGLTSAAMVAKELGAVNAFASTLNSACSSQLVHLMMAQALVSSGQCSYVLSVASNIMSRGLTLGHPASPGIGDGATAILIGPNTQPGHQILQTYARSHGDYWDAVVWKRHQGESQDWLQAGGDFYVGSYCSAQARELVQITAKMGAQTIQEACSTINISPSALRFVFSVQPRQWVPVAITKLLGLQDNQTVETYQKYAHVGCCGPVVNLLEAEQQGLLQPGDWIGLYAQGAGFTRSATILQW